MPLIKLCDFDELAEVDSRSFVISEFTPARDIFIVRHHNTVFAYLNSCPHNLAPLNWSPDVFLSYDKDYIQCANHGALFEIDSGPCTGKLLESVSIRIDNGAIYAQF